MRSRDYHSGPITRYPNACPKCGSIQIRRSRNYFVHLVRAFNGSRKRYCVNCGERWCASLLPAAPSLLSTRDMVVPGLVAAGVFLLVFTAWFELRHWGEAKALLGRTLALVRLAMAGGGE